jgi:hypothetical protein
MNRTVLHRALLSSFLAAAFLLSPGRSPAAADLRPGYLLIHSQDVRVSLEILEQVRERGGRRLHLMPPGILAGDLPAALAGDELGSPGTVTLRWDDGPRGAAAAAAEDLDPDRSAFLEGWRRGREGLGPVLGTRAPGENGDLGPADDLVLRVTREEARRVRAEEAERLAGQETEEEPRRGPDQNSEFMIGRIVVNVVMPESDGSLENWSAQEISQVKGGVIAGWTSYTNHFFYAPVTLIYNFHVQVPVTLEPGHHTPDTEWVGASMKSLGYSSSETGVQGQVHAMNQETRRFFFADWSYTTFIADTSNQPDHYLASSGGSYVAYAFLGGPYLVCPFPAGRFDVEGFDHVFIHESSHCFWALDEYASANQPCGLRSGYLAVRNGNSYAGFNGQPCGEELPCIMNNYSLEELEICPYTAGQVGVIDTDGDRIPRVWNIPPEAEFDGGPVDTLLELQGTISGRAYCPPKENLNTAWDPDERNNYAAPLFRGKLEIGGFAKFFKPVDGRWNQSEERFEVPTIGVVPGSNVMRFTFSNEVGLENPAPVEKRLFVIGINYTTPVVVTHYRLNEVQWTVVGEDFGAEYEVLRRDPEGTGDWEVLSGPIEVRELETGLVKYLYLDDGVEPGSPYAYRARGTFSLLYHDSLNTFVYDSPPRSVLAQAPLGSALVSSMLPNPMQDHGVFTFVVPTRYSEGFPGGVEGSREGGVRPSPLLSGVVVPTDTWVAVYNVKGERVRTIENAPLYGGRHTRSWDARDDRGRRVSAGVYFLRVQAGSQIATRKIVVIN